MQIQLQRQLQLQVQWHCTSLRHATSCSCGWGDHCNHSNKHNHLSVHQLIRSAIHASQQLISPIRFLSLELLPPPRAVLLVLYIFWYQHYIGNYGMTTIYWNCHLAVRNCWWLRRGSGCFHGRDSVQIHDFKSWQMPSWKVPCLHGPAPWSAAIAVRRQMVFYLDIWVFLKSWTSKSPGVPPWLKTPPNIFKPSFLPGRFEVWTTWRILAQILWTILIGITLGLGHSYHWVVLLSSSVIERWRQNGGRWALD